MAENFQIFSPGHSVAENRHQKPASIFTKGVSNLATGAMRMKFSVCHHDVIAIKHHAVEEIGDGAGVVLKDDITVAKTSVEAITRAVTGTNPCYGCYNLFFISARLAAFVDAFPLYAIRARTDEIHFHRCACFLSRMGEDWVDLFHALSNDDGRLSSLEAKLAHFSLENVDFVVNSSITELAERAGVSPPTVTRFCRRLGCQGYSDFKVQLAKLAYVGLRYLKPEAPTATAEEVAHDIVSKAQNALFELHRQLDLTVIEKAAQLLRGADFIQAFGASGNSAMIVNELHNRLFRLGCRVNASNDHNMNLMISAAAEPGTVVFGSSFTGRDMGLVHCLELLRQREIPSIIMTQGGSPVAEAADLVIAIEMPEGKNIFRPTSTRYAYLAAVDILANMVAYADRNKALKALRSIKEELVRNRDGDDRQLLGD